MKILKNIEKNIEHQMIEILFTRCKRVLKTKQHKTITALCKKKFANKNELIESILASEFNFYQKNRLIWYVLGSFDVLNLSNQPPELINVFLQRVYLGYRIYGAWDSLPNPLPIKPKKDNKVDFKLLNSIKIP